MQDRIQGLSRGATERSSFQILRPHFLSRRQFDSLVKSTEALISAVDRVQDMVLQNPAMQARMDLLPAEKMLAAIDPGYSGLSVLSRLDSYVDNGSLRLMQYSPDTLPGLPSSEILNEAFLDCPPMKEFRQRYQVTASGGKKHLLHALLKAYKQFGGKKTPNIAILEFKTPGADEYAYIRDYFRKEGYPAEIVNPENLEYRNGVLRKPGFDIDLIFRRISAAELLVRFDLSHPLLQAYRDHAVCMVNSFRAELARKKSIFGPLTDESVIAKFPAHEKKAIRDHVPWTRLVAATKTTFQDQTVSLPEFIVENREKLVLRPNDDFQAGDSYSGWEMEQNAWERAVRLAMRSPYVVQERVDPVSVQFPLWNFGHLEYREMRVDVQPVAFLGKVLGCSSWLTDAGGGYSAVSGFVPTYVIDSKA